MVDALSLMVSNCVQGMIMERFEVGKNQVTLPISIWRMIVYPFVRSSLDNDLIKVGEWANLVDCEVGVFLTLYLGLLGVRGG